MNRRALLAALPAAAAGLGLAAPAAARAAAPPEETRLFNGHNFDGWYTYLRDYGKNRDPERIFQIRPGGVIHVSGRRYGYLSTEQEYADYRLSLEFRWGTKKWPPRERKLRDAGVLYHCVGRDKVWMESLECQIMEGDCGDMFLTRGDGGRPALTVNGRRYVGQRVVRFADYERPHGEWNQVVVVADGDHIQHYINGRLNMEGTEASLTRGKINLQSEGAEIYYRNITLEPLR